ncbi:hypothetical protein ASC80_05780 [Afipia sp. Root123D2]|uniref:hypothetical protein n=1 Tax=Afipia sp. Root123D2 TaxID=1736436 RepID=UPI0006FE8DDB|nr:hypothetical protein [Afipia sp. Root123D2]KQW22850.1 hypothetical protein ASC80_05780 [Afipia sp. Root123D2]
MAGFLKFVAGACLVVTWLGFGLIAFGAIMSTDPSTQSGGFWIYAVLTCIGVSLPAAILFAFAAVVEDVAEMKGHLAAMRRYYEPQR